MAGFTNLGDLIGRDRDLGKTAIIDLGGEQAPREFSYAQLDADGERRRARAIAARACARRPRGDPVGQSRRISRRLFRDHAGWARRCPGEFQVPAPDHPFHPARCRCQARILRSAAPRAIVRRNCRVSEFGVGRRELLRRLPRSRSVRRGRAAAATSRRCSSTRRARPARPRASCSRTRATSGWRRRGSRPASTAIVISSRRRSIT